MQTLYVYGLSKRTRWTCGSRLKIVTGVFQVLDVARSIRAALECQIQFPDESATVDARPSKAAHVVAALLPLLPVVAPYATLQFVIRSFQRRGLRQYFTKGNKKGISSFNVDRIRRILSALNAATSPLSLMLPGFDTHELGGNRKGT